MQILSEGTKFRFLNDINIPIMVIFLFGVLLIVCSITLLADDSDDILGMLSMILGLVFIALSLIWGNNSASTEYKVTLTDDYPAKELLSKYKVMEIDGDIYILRDLKEHEEVSESENSI